jgi:Cytochrome P460
MTTRVFVLAFVIALLSGASGATVQGGGRSDHFDLVDAKGTLRKPPAYRDRFQILGTWTVIDPKGDEMHFTYASPGTAEFYRKNKKFADGTVLVKEVFGTNHAKLPTGDAHWAQGTKVWFVMIKDDKGRFSGNPLWGNGWGWALYKSDAPDKQVATDFKKDCLGCHIPAKDTDWIYVHGYPVLGVQ